MTGKKGLLFLIAALLAGLIIFIEPAAADTTGRVIDALTGRPVAGAIVTAGHEFAVTDENGFFVIKSAVARVAVRACGYLRVDDAFVAPLVTVPLPVEIAPFQPKALYLSFFGIGSKILRGAALRLVETTELNALVIDVKGDRGGIIYRSSIPLASEIGAQKIITVKDVRALLLSLKEKGVYTIARIVVFKDNLLAHARPELAVKTSGGGIWSDRENLAWVDPFRREIWDYNAEIAVEAARLGFDEIQFDYVRFPDARGLSFSQPNTEENRVKAVTGFLREARRGLTPYNVFLSADIFGYVFWNLNDTDIGQKLDEIAPVVDYLSPMLYPSGFQYGIPGYRNPVAHPYEIVYRSLRKARARTMLPPVRFRPWLQAFKDYAFDGRPFNGTEIRAQIAASEEFGSDGWMLWNPRNVYTEEGLRQ